MFNLEKNMSIQGNFVFCERYDNYNENMNGWSRRTHALVRLDQIKWIEERKDLLGRCLIFLDKNQWYCVNMSLCDLHAALEIYYNENRISQGVKLDVEDLHKFYCDGNKHRGRDMPTDQAPILSESTLDRSNESNST
jgi:hypothetical protein